MPSLMFDYGILQNGGKISAEIAKFHTQTEFEKYRIIQDQRYRYTGKL